MNKGSSLTVYKIVFICFFLLSFIPIQKAIAQAGNAVINATDPRHETLTQRQVSVLFDQNILSATIPGWTVTVNAISVTINSVTVLGNRVNINFDATPAHAAQNFLIPGDVVRVSYSQAAGNTLTATAGNPEVNSFALSLSKNRWIGNCTDFAFFQIGDYAAPDICSPVINNFRQFQYFLSLRLRNSAVFNYATQMRYQINWGDGSALQNVAPYLSDNAGTANAAFFTTVPGFPAVVTTSRQIHNFPDNTNVCSFNLRIFPYIDGVLNCNIGSLLQTSTFISYDMDDQNTGILSMIPSVANSNLVCLGNNANMRFSDATTLNCVPDVPNIGAPNVQARWIRIVYGFQNAVAPGNIPNIRVNGPLTGGAQNITNGAGVISPVGGYFPIGGGGVGVPDANGVIELATPVNVSTATTFMQTITTSSPVGQVVGQRFWVRLDYWNTCNPYNPGDLTNRVSTTNSVEIIGSPNPPAVNNPTLCENAANGSFNITATGVGAGALTYTWYLDAGLTTVLQATNADNTFNPVTEGPVGNRINKNVAVSTTFNRFVTVTQGSNNCTSQPQTITIRIDALNTAGTIAHPLGATPFTLCSGTDPAAFTSPDNGTGGGPGGAITYQWQQSPTGGGVGFVAAAGVNNLVTYDPPALVARTFFRRRIQSGQCADVFSNEIEFRIDTPVIGGTVGSNQTICEAPGDPANLTNIASPTGGSNTGTYNFQWEESTISVVGPFNTIAGATLNTYNPPAGVTTTTHYRRRVNSGVCAVDGPDAGTDPDNIAYSNVITITVDQIVVPGSIGNPQSICSGQDPAVLTQIAAPSGGNGSTYTFLWQESATGGGVGFAAAPGANTGATYDPPVLVATRFYRRQVTSGVCSPTFSNEIQVTVNALPTVVLSGGGSICSGNPAPDVVFTFTGAGPWDLVYSINGVNQPVVNNTTSPFTLANPAAGVYAVVSINDNNTPNCLVTAPNANITGGATVTIQAIPPPTVETFTATAAVCDDGGATNPPDAILDLLPNSAQFYDITYTVNGNTFTELNKSSDASGQLTIQPPYTAWGSVPGSYVVTVTALKNTLTLCAGAVPFNSAPLVVNPRPALPAGPVNGIACSVPGTGVPLSVTDPGVGFEIEWSTAGPALASFAAAVPGSGAESGTNNRTFTPTTSATATFFAFTRNTTTGCFSSTGRAVTQTQDLRPTAAAAGPDQPLLCATSATLAATAVNNGGTGTWSVVGPVGTIVITSPNSFNSTVTGLPQDVPGGLPINTTLRWTATSALSVCSPTQDDVILTVNPLPAVTNLTPQLCEDVSGGGSRANFDLTTLNSSVTGGAAGVTVEWFADPIPASPILPATTPQNITNGAGGTYFVRLTSTAGCQNTGTVTFTVNSLPAAVDRNFQFCENTVGAGLAGNFAGNTINLTTFEFGAGGVTNGGTAVTRDVEWYEDAALTTLIAPGAGVGQEQNYTITATKTIFAKVIDLTSPVTPRCFDVADVTLTLKLRPADNPITGGATVCTGSTIVLYQVNPGLNPGSNYTWSVTSAVADFQVFGGGGINSPNFFILLKFPGPAIGNVDISVFETLNGCTGNTSNFTVTVAGAPGALTFNSPQTNVCNNQTGVVYSLNAPNPLSLYTWTAPGASFQGPSSGVGLSSVTLDFTTITPVTISVTETSSSGCAGSPAAVVVNLVDRPVMSSSNTTSVCSGSAPALAFAATLSGLPTASVTFGWQVINISGSVSGTTVGNTGTGNLSELLTNTSGVIGTVTYRVTPTETVVPNPPNCTGTPQDVVVTVNPEPVLVTPQTKTICSNQPVNHQILLNPATLPVGTVFNWGLPTMSNASVQGSPGVNVAVGATPHITDVLVNLTTAPITATYMITPSNGSCSGTPQSVVITVNPQPVGAADTKTICSNTTVSYNLQATNIDVLGNSLPSTFSWIAASNPSVTGESTSAQNTAIINDNLRNVTNLDQLVVYTITPTGANGCAGSPFTVSITVKPEPVGVADTKTICSNAVVNYDLQVSNINTLGNGLASTFSWVAASTANVSGESTSPQPGATINDLLINTTSVNQTVTYTVTPTSSVGICTGSTFIITLTVQPQPVGVNDVTNTCSDVVLSYSLQNNINTLGNAIVSTFSWVAAANGNVSGESTIPKVTGTINDVLNNVTGSDQVVVYTVTPTSGNGCAGNPFTVSVTVKSEPLGAADVKTICSDASVGYNLQVTNLDILGNSQPSSFSWVAASNLNVTGESTASQAGGTITDILNNVTATDQTVIYTVTPTGVNGCIGNPFTITVTVQPEPLGVNSTKTICSDASVNYDLQVTNIDGLGNGLASTFTWAAASNPDVSGESTAPQAGSTINDVLNNVTSIDQVVVYTVTPTSSVGGCVGNPFTISVTVRPEPVGVNDVTNTCSDVVLSYSLQNNINTLGNAIVSTFSWVAAANGNVSGESTIPKVTGTINDVLNNVTGSDQVVVYTVTPTSGNGCAGNPFTVSVTVKSEPLGAADVKTICSDASVGYNLQVTNLDILGNSQPSSFSWVAASNGSVGGESTTPQVGSTITDILNNVTTSNQTVVYTVTPTGINGCIGNPFVVTITVQPEPVGANATMTICSDGNVNYDLQVANINTLGNSLASTFSWVAASNTNVTGESTAPQAGGTINDVLNNVTNSDQIVVYTVTPTSTGPGCIGNPFTVSVTVRPEPVGGADVASVCSDVALTYNLQNNVTSLGNGLPASFSWVAASNLNVGGESIAPVAGGTINDVLNNVTGSDQVVVYTITPTSTFGCLGNPFVVSITVRSEPVGAADTKTICSDESVNYNLQTNVTSLGNGQNANFTWVATSNANVTGESTAAQVGATITDILNNVTNLDQVVTYTVMPTGANGCPGNPFTINITVQPEPVGMNDTKTICGNLNVNYDLQNNINVLGNGLSSSFSWVATANPNVSGESTTSQVGSLINDLLVNVTNADQNVVYTATPAGINGCDGNLFTITVTVRPQPIGVNDTKTVCSDISVAYDLQNNINVLGNALPSSFSWVAASNGNVTGESTSPVVGPIITDVINNVTGADEAVVYTVTPTSTLGCIGAPFTVSITVRSEPVGVADAITICSDVNVSYSLQNNINTLGNGIVSGFSWVATPNANVTGESTSAQATGTINDVVTNVTNVDQQVIYTVTPTGINGCIGNPFLITVTVRPEPVGVNDTKTICSDAIVNYNLTSNVNTLGNNLASTFSWVATANTNVTGESTLPQVGSIITDALNNVSGIDQTVVYTITPTSNDGCVGNTFTVSITIQSEPVGLADVKAVCSDAPVNYALQTNVNTLGNNVVSTFSWIAAANANVTGESSTAQAGGTITDVLNNVTGADEIVVYTVTPTSSTGCAGNPFVVTVTVRPEPVGGSDTKTICSDATVNYDLTNNVATLGNNLGANFNWVAAANGSVSGESLTSQAGAIITDLLNNVSGVDQVVVYTITPTGINGCVGNPFTVSVTVQSEPIGLADGVSICSDQNVAYDLQNNVNTLGNNVTSTFSWQAAANPSVTGESTTPQAGGIISDILSNTSGVSQVVDYTVTPTGTNGCPGNPFLVSVTVRSEPLGVNDAKSICSDDNVNYDLQNNISSLGNSVTSTFSWIAATNPNVSGESTTPKTGSIINDVLNNVSNIDELVTYTITPTGANGCLGNLFTVTITVQPEPKGLNDVATINSDIALAYDLQNNVNTLGNGLAASFSWVAASSVNVSGESTTPQAGGFINDILNNITNANQAVIYTVTPTGVNGCVGNTFLITVTVLPEPVGINDAVTVNSDVTVNYNLQTNVNSLGNGLPSTFSWVAAPNPNVTGESAGPQSGPIITDVITNITGVDQVVIYTVTPTGTNGVLGDPFTITVTVRSEPLGADDTKTICSDATVAYDLQNNINTLGNGVASTFTWVAASNTNVSGESTTLQAGSLITDVLNNVTNADQLVFYTVIPTGNNSVVGNPFTITVVVQPEPVIDPALASKTICSRDITNITLNTDGVSVAAANYNISLVSQDAGLTGVPTTGNGLAPNAILNNSFINLTSTPLKVVYQIVPISAVGCVGNPFNITLTVNAEPVVNTALDNTVCSQEISNIILSTNGTSVAASSYQLVSVTVPGTITADGSNAVAGSISSVNLIRNDKYTNNTSGPVIVIYEIVGISPAGCIGQPEFINLTVNPAPIMIPGTANLCSDVPSGIIVGPAAGSATITQFELKNVVKAPALVAGGSNAGLGIYAANLAGGQSDFLSNDTFTNTTNGPLIVTYTVVPIAAGCRGLDQTVVFTVNPAPAVDDNLNRTVCSDGVAGIVFATETSPLSTAAASYNIVTIIVQAGLVRTAGSAAVPRNGVTANDIQADQFRNPTNDPLTVTYGVQAVSGASCLGPIRNIVLTVEPEIIATPVNNAPNICSNDQTDIDLISPTNPTSGVVTFNYTAVSSVGGLISGFVPALNNLPENYKIEDALVNNSDNPATVTYSISAVANGARNGAGCASLPPAVTVVVSVDPKPKLVASPSIQTVCEGVATAVTLNSNTVPSAGNVRFELLSAAASGGVTGMSAVGTLFTPGSSLADILNNPTVTSQTVTYTFQPKVIGGLGCAGDNVVVTITVNPLPTIVASAQPDICSGDFINITLTPDVANTVALWTVSAPGTVTGASNGAGNLIFQTLFNSGNIPETVNYTVTPRVNGCNGTPIVVSVVVNPKPKFVGLPTAVTVCHGGTLNVPLTSTVAGTTFDWVVDDPSGLGVPLTGSGNVINQPLTNTTGSQASLTYTITPTGPGNCPGDQKLIIVTVAPQINALFVNTSSSICKGSSEFLIIQIDGQAPFQLVYNDGTSDITVNNAGNFKVIQVTPTATTTYTIKSIKDALNCSFLPVGQTVTVTVGETDANFSIVGPASSCGPYLATFQYNQVAGTEYTWQWFDGSPDDVFLAATSIPNTTITHTFTNPNPNAAITYKVTLRTQLPAPFPGCFKSTTTNVTVFPSIITNAFPDRTEICSGESIQFFNQSFGATSHRWFYRVQGTATEIDIRTTPTVNYNFVNTSTSNPIIYEVVYQANNGNCPAADVVMPITVYRAITAGFNEGTVPPFIGGNSTVTFTNTSTPIDVTQFRYEWEFGLNSTPATGNGVGPFSVNYSTPGPRDITLKVVNIAAETALLGCESTFTKTINIPLLPLVAAFTADPVRACFPSDITVLTNTSTGDVMDWRVVDSNGRIAATSNAPLPVFRITNPGVYSIFLTTSNSLTGQVANTQQDNFEVFDNPVASFDLRPTTVYVPDTELTTFNFSIGATDYDWDFGDGGNSTDIEPTYVYKVEGAYDVRLIARNDHGQGLVCTDTLIRKVTAKQGGVTKVPNAFTPNPNGPSGGNPGGPGSGGSGSFNDVFLPIVKGAEEFNMQIFDRWGNLIFESNSANVGWDGYNDNGKLMPAGVYVYKLTIRLSDGQRSTQIGDVTMIR